MNPDTDTIPLATLVTRWPHWRLMLKGEDVTCENCGTAALQHEDRDLPRLCPACAFALGEDLLGIYARIGSR